MPLIQIQILAVLSLLTGFTLIRENRSEWITMYAHLLFLNGMWKDNRNVPCTSIRFALYHFATFTIIYTTLRHTASSLKVLLLLRYAHISQVRKVIMAHLLFSWDVISNASERANERVPQCKIKRTEFSAPFGKNQTLFHEAPQCVCVWQIRVKTVTTRTVRKCIHKNKLCHKIP